MLHILDKYESSSHVNADDPAPVSRAVRQDTRFVGGHFGSLDHFDLRGNILRCIRIQLLCVKVNVLLQCFHCFVFPFRLPQSFFQGSGKVSPPRRLVAVGCKQYLAVESAILLRDYTHVLDA